MQFFFSTLLSFAGIGIALVVVCLNILNLVQKKGVWNPLFYIGIGGFYAFALVANLVRQSSGLYCAVSPLRTLVIYGGLLILHFFFAWDSLKLYTKKPEPQPIDTP